MNTKGKKRQTSRGCEVTWPTIGNAIKSGESWSEYQYRINELRLRIVLPFTQILFWIFQNCNTYRPTLYNYIFQQGDSIVSPGAVPLVTVIVSKWELIWAGNESTFDRSWVTEKRMFLVPKGSGSLDRVGSSRLFGVGMPNGTPNFL